MDLPYDIRAYLLKGKVSTFLKDEAYERIEKHYVHIFSSQPFKMTLTKRIRCIYNILYFHEFESHLLLIPFIWKTLLSVPVKDRLTGSELQIKQIVYDASLFLRGTSLAPNSFAQSKIFEVI